MWIIRVNGILGWRLSDWGFVNTTQWQNQQSLSYQPNICRIWVLFKKLHKICNSKFVKLEISIRRGRKLRKFLGDSQDGGQSFDRALTIRLRTEITAGMATFGGSKNTMADSVESHSRLEWPRGWRTVRFWLSEWTAASDAWTVERGATRATEIEFIFRNTVTRFRKCFSLSLCIFLQQTPYRKNFLPLISRENCPGKLKSRTFVRR